MYDYLTNISSALSHGVNVSDFADSLSHTQYTSKKWLVDVLSQQDYTSNPAILILGGWYGSYLVPMLNKALNPSKIYFNDINTDCLEVAKRLHRGSNIEFHHFDATHESFNRYVDIIINTSCEHMHSYEHMLQRDSSCLFVLQTCDNINDPGHINTSASTNDFLDKLQLRKVNYVGRRSLGHKNRFMVIGRN